MTVIPHSSIIFHVVLKEAGIYIYIYIYIYILERFTKQLLPVNYDKKAFITCFTI